MSDRTEILIKYVINLSKGIDNSFAIAVMSNLGQNPQKKFLSDVEKLSKSSEEIKMLYIAAMKRVEKIDVNTVPYNLSLVCFVTSFEILLYDLFAFILNNDENLKKKILNSESRVPIEYLEKYKNNEISFADIVIKIKNFNFQNLESASNAFIWLGKPSILKILNDLKHLEKIRDAINKRHRIVHQGFNDDTMTMDEVAELNAIFLISGITIYGQIFYNYSK